MESTVRLAAKGASPRGKGVEGEDMETLNMVKKATIRQNTDNIAHTLRLLTLLEADGKSIERIELELAENNLVWIITASDVLKFKYHVNIRGKAIQYYTAKHSRSYVGDIPDFALERAELALRLGIRNITLHSMNPLPVTRVHIDPVMVGWIQDAAIHTDKDGEFFTYWPKNEGVVLAIWDNEKELEL